MTGLLYVVAVLFSVVVGILWILVPFLIMGTNRRLDRLIAQNAVRLKERGGDVDPTAPVGAREYASALGALFTGKDK